MGVRLISKYIRTFHFPTKELAKRISGIQSLQKHVQSRYDVDTLNYRPIGYDIKDNLLLEGNIPANKTQHSHTVQGCK